MQDDPIVRCVVVVFLLVVIIGLVWSWFAAGSKPAAPALPTNELRLTLLDLLDLISKAELVGSRGYARKYGKKRFAGADHDWAIFTDDADVLSLCRLIAGDIMKRDASFKIIERSNRFTLHSNEYRIDISICPTIMRDITHHAWEAMVTGVDKLEAWRYAHRFFNVPCDD